MKNKIGFLTMLPYLLTLLSCESEINYKETKKLKKILEIYNQPQNLDDNVYIINSTSGCGGCIAITSDFIIKNLSNKRLKCIVCSYSRKEVKSQYNKLIMQNNFIFDSLNIATQLRLWNGKPVIIYCKDGNILKKSEIEYSSAKDSLYKVLEYIY